MGTWASRERGEERDGSAGRTAARMVIDAHGAVVAWNQGAERLLGHPAGEVLGRPVLDLLATDPGTADAGSGGVLLRHRDGRTVACRPALRAVRDDGTGPSLTVDLLTGAPGLTPDIDRALLETLFTRSPIGLFVLDPQLRLMRFNPAAEGMQDHRSQLALGRRPTEAWPDFSAELAERVMGRVLRTGEAAISFEKRGRPPGDPGREHVYSASAFRLEAEDGRILGVADAVIDVTERHLAEQRLALMAEAGRTIGRTLDPIRTAQELAEVAVPVLADCVCVDLLAPLLGGEEMAAGPVEDDTGLRRAATSARCGQTGAYTTGAVSAHLVGSPALQVLADHEPRLVPRLSQDSACIRDEPVRGGRMLEERVHSLMVVPLLVRDCVLGLVTFHRWDPDLGPFDEDDLALAVDLAGRGAMALDNAHRYVRERNAVLALQRGMLPQRLPAPSAVEWGHHLVRSGAGGDWTEVIPLPGARVALVSGSTPGRGMRTAATMGRLRAAVHTLANLDQDPDEVLARLDDLVRNLAEEHAGTGSGFPAGATCLYLVYDPVTGQSTMASAGHPPPSVVYPDHTVWTPAAPAGEPLGRPGPSFGTTTLELPEECMLVLRTPGLLQSHPEEPGRAEFERLLATPCDSPQDMSLLLTDALVPADPGHDASVLVARPRPLGPDSVATWNLPCDPAAVATARTLTTRQLSAWALQEECFATELIVSELVTNAIRYATPPIQLRLIRDRALTCEVSDTSSAAPFLRHARTTDEGGRGLLLVSQFAERWGTRYRERGKTIWTEQTIAV
ncbi:SpoIIE family protein phosphatase [Actinacidiphila sp. bgisy160]|uniref:SpoIIE family protein phosphatase n=1 Tax=Actinacidiphila sp. bgisy160 TaxID=3413796 RepID=UPI003D763861